MMNMLTHKNKRKFLILLVLCFASCSCALLAIYFYLNPLQIRPCSIFAIPKECLEKKQKQREKGHQLNASDPTVIALRSPTFSNKTFPHLLIGNFINAGKDILTN
jgi:hypothetical protein